MDPKVQKSIVESLDSDRVAEIVEEMQPDAAADLLADLSDEKTESILEEMAPEEREEVSGLLEFKENSAAGRMTTQYLSLPVTANVHDAIEALRHFEGGIETVSTVFLVDSRRYPLRHRALGEDGPCHPYHSSPGSHPGAANLLPRRGQRKKRSPNCSTSTIF